MWVNGEPYFDFDAEGLTVQLPEFDTPDHQHMISRRRAGGVLMHHYKDDVARQSTHRSRLNAAFFMLQVLAEMLQVLAAFNFNLRSL